MKTLLHLLLSWIRLKRINVFILFLMMSLLISVIIKLSNETTHTLRIQWTPIHNNPKEVLLNPNKFIDVTVKSNGFGVLKFAFSGIKLNVDLTSVSKKGSEYFLSEDEQLMLVSNFFGSNVEIINFFPKTISFGYDEQAIKSVPVVVQSQISFATGYDMLSSLRAEPDSVILVGSKNMLKGVHSIFTAPISFENLNSNVSQEVQLLTPESLKVQNLTQTKVKVVGDVEKFTEGVINVPVQLINRPDNKLVSIFPKEIPVVFYTTLEVFKSISPLDFRIECDYDALQNSNDFLIPRLVSYPKQVKRADLQLKQVEYVISAQND